MGYINLIIMTIHANPLEVLIFRWLIPWLFIILNCQTNIIKLAVLNLTYKFCINYWRPTNRCLLLCLSRFLLWYRSYLCLGHFRSGMLRPWKERFERLSRIWARRVLNQRARNRRLKLAWFLLLHAKPRVRMSHQIHKLFPTVVILFHCQPSSCFPLLPSMAYEILVSYLLVHSVSWCAILL